VPECDEFIAAYDACVSSKVPETARAQYKTAIAQWRSSWSKLRRKPKHQGNLGSGLQAISRVCTRLNEVVRLHVLIDFFFCSL